MDERHASPKSKRWACKALDEDDPSALFKRLPKNPKEWEVLDDTGYSLLETALTAKALKCTKELLKQGVSARAGVSKYPPLSTLLAQGELSKSHQRVYGLLTALIGSGADVNETDESGASALHVAAKGEIGRALRPLWDGTETTKVIPNPNLPDRNLDTPTHAIFQVPHTPKEVMEWLTWSSRHQTDWTLKNVRNETPIHLAFFSNPSWTNAARWKVLEVVAEGGGRIEKAAYASLIPTHLMPEDARWAEWERLTLRSRVMKTGVELKNEAQPSAI